MKILALFLALATVAAHAEAPLWVTVTSNATAAFAFKRGSCKAVDSDKGVHALVCIERQTAPDGTSMFHYVAIDRDTCPTGVGEILTSDMRGTLLADDQVVADGGTIASQEWEFMCGVSGTIK
jgi:hypothetical protein